MEERKEFIEDYDIRLIKEEDLPIVSRIYTESFNQANIGEEWSDERALEFMGWWFKRQPDLFFVAENQNKEIIGGVVAGVKPWWNGNHLVDGEIFVKPQEYKKGIGTTLLSRIIEESIQKYKIKEFEGLADEGEFPLSWYEKIGINRTSLVHISGDANQILANLKGLDK